MIFTSAGQARKYIMDNRHRIKYSVYNGLRPLFKHLGIEYINHMGNIRKVVEALKQLGWRRMELTNISVWISPDNHLPIKDK